HIEEMGKNIVRREHPDEPNKHSRLWIKEEIDDILANDLGTEATRYLKLTMSRGNLRSVMKGLGKMKKLQYLELGQAFLSFTMKKPQFLEVKLDSLNSLKYLKCTNCPFLYLSKPDNLVGLEMKSNRMVFKKLKFLSLNEPYLTTFDFRITPNLETLSLIFSTDLVELCMPVCCQKLNYLHINLSKLKTFDLGLTPNLETLSFSDCADFVELQVSAPCTNLKFLNLRNLRLRSLDLGLTPNLEWLYLINCADFVELQVSAPCTNLKFLNLCNLRLRSLDLELIPNLESLDLSYCNEVVEINA
ncbi:disease resistance TIR-NBS-LRR class family protein, partial [Tanacetum coccineum]